MRAKFPFKKKKKRVGRGPGSGHGKTACRGQKGQLSRSGEGHTAGFEGGQNPFIRRIPKRGFTHVFKKQYAVINLSKLGELKEKEISPEKLIERGIVKDLGAGLKILGDGELKAAITVRAHKFSGQAKEKIEKAGGAALLIEKAAAGGPGKASQD
ncbi:MAG: 50S ribosomal protein L15 [Omnitrophica bacterium GWA2_50_21]|nr:MAG: 50S ribosomal protein L15 [Omnitrophica bacterium GWA2_50_21]